MRVSPSAATVGRSRRCAPARPRCRPEKEPLASREHRIKGGEIQTRMFHFKKVRTRLVLLARSLIFPAASERRGRMTESESMTNDETRSIALYHSGSGIFSSFVIRVSSFLVISLSIVLPASQAADNLGILGAHPKWAVLENYQETITHDEFARLIQGVYCTHGFAPDLIEISEKSARILTNREAQKFFTLRFAKDDASREPIPRLWRAAESLPPAKQEKPLSSLRIALDPGHLGGKWAKMEERWFQVGATPPKRPDDFKELARRILIKNGVPQRRVDVLDASDPEKEQTIRWQSEILFYRYSEIRRRAALVDFKLHPDLVLCLHFNAEGWGDSNNPTLIDTNHLHLLVNGSYLQDELEFDDERFEMIRRLLSRAYDEELPLADGVATAMAKEMQLPPYQYPTTLTTTKVGTSGYVYARNLLATRIYRCPVVYCEPYVMNSNDVFARIQAGDYEGMRNVNGVERKSIFREYADSVVDGLVEYYRNARGRGD